MKKIMLIAICLVFSGCLTLFHDTKIQKSNKAVINQRILEDEIVSFITKGEKEYRLKLTSLDSAFINGIGEMRKKNDETWTNFEGAVPLDSIDLLVFEESEYLASILVGGAALYTLSGYFDASRKPDGIGNPSLDVNVKYPPGPPTGGSCPFIYSYGEGGFLLEGEAFGIALGKAREMTTSTVLNNIDLKSTDVKVRITNERPETHFINKVALYSVESEINAEAMGDNDQNIWPVYNIEKPLSASDNSTKNILKEIVAKDGLFWKSSLTHPVIFKNSEDQIELCFDRPAHSRDASLVVRGINTSFGVHVFQKLFEFLGDQSLSFMHAIENDEQVINLMDQWTKESSLKASIWNGSSWLPCGLLYPEADRVQFSRIIRINIPPNIGNIVKLRLTSMADLWEIDKIGMDWTDVKMLNKKEVPLKSLEGDLTEKTVDQIKNNDDQYAVLTPSQRLDLNYAKQRAAVGKKLSYTLDVGGYLYEWLPAEGENSIFTGMDDIFNNDRLAFVKYMLENKNLLLPPLYAEWVSTGRKLDLN